MKYDLTNGFTEYLKKSLRPTTAHTYNNRIELLLKGQSLFNENIDLENIVYNLSKIKYKNDFSQSKNALLHFFEYKNISPPHEILKKIKTLEDKTNKKNRKQKIINFSKVNQAIRHINNKKLKLSFEVMLNTGLRVSEISQIKKSDCKINDEKIVFLFIGKGGEPEEIILYKKINKKLFDILKSEITEKAPNEKLFYSMSYLQKKAEELGFSCHDLRRIYAKQEYKRTKSKRKVKENLRHKNIKTTEIYLNSKVKF